MTLRRILALCAVGVAAAGCTVGPDYVRPEVSVPAGLSRRRLRVRRPPARRRSVISTGGASFPDPDLQELVRTALAQNYDLRIAVTRILQAQSQVTIARSQEFPTVDGSVSAPYAGYTGSDRPATLPDNSFAPQAGLGVAWELDFWGRFRRNTEAAQADLLASEDARYRGDGHAGHRGRPGVSDPAGPGSDARNLPAHRHLAEAIARPRPGPAGRRRGRDTRSAAGRDAALQRDEDDPRDPAPDRADRELHQHPARAESGADQARAPARGSRSRPRRCRRACRRTSSRGGRTSAGRSSNWLRRTRRSASPRRCSIPQITISGFAGAGGATISGSSFGPFGIFNALAGHHPAHLQHGSPAGQRGLQRGARPGSGPALPADAAAGVPRSVRTRWSTSGSGRSSGSSRNCWSRPWRTPARSRTCATRAECPATWRSWTPSASSSTRNSSWSRRKRDESVSVVQLYKALGGGWQAESAKIAATGGERTPSK